MKIELQGEEIVFDPPFEAVSCQAAKRCESECQDEDLPGRTTLRSTIDGWLKDFFAMATVMARIPEKLVSRPFFLSLFSVRLSARSAWTPTWATT